MASLVERNNRYYAVYTYETEDGERKQKWEGFNTKADVVRSSRARGAKRAGLRRRPALSV